MVLSRFIKLVILVFLLFVIGTCEANYIEPFAGSYTQGSNGDGGLAFKPFTMLNIPKGIAVDSKGNIYIVDGQNQIIRKIDNATKIVTTIAGIPATPGYSGDNGLATLAQLNNPIGICIDQSDNIYVADMDNHVIRRIDSLTNIITTVVGNGQRGYSGDNGPATAAELTSPTHVNFDSNGNMYITDLSNYVRKVDKATNIISTFAGTGTPSLSGNNGLATAATINKPTSVHTDLLGNILIVDSLNHVIRKIDKTTQVITTIVGTSTMGYSGDSGLATSAQLSSPIDLCFDSEGNMYITDQGNYVIRKVDGQTNIISTFVGNFRGYSGDNGPATAAKIDSPSYCVVFGGNLYFTDEASQVMRRVDLSSNIITTVAGSGSRGYGGDGAVAEGTNLPQLNEPRKVIVDPQGRIVIVDTSNNEIRQVDPKTGIISIIAGSGSAQHGGDGGLATDAGFAFPAGACFDSIGNLYITTSNSVVRKVEKKSQIISTIAGTPDVYGYSGDGGLATSATLQMPYDVAVSLNGNVYIVDTNANIIRLITSDKKISTFAGTPLSAGYGGDNDLAIFAKLKEPRGICLDSQGNVIIADKGNHVLRKVDIKTNIITTIAGVGFKGYSGDNGPATSAKMKEPYACHVDRFDNIYIAEFGSNIVRYIDNKSQFIYRIAGKPDWIGNSGDFSEPTNAVLNNPSGVAVDSLGSVYIADSQNHVIRRVVFNCSGVLSNDPSVCGAPHGMCTYLGCVCEEGYIFNGTTCTRLMECNSLQKDDPNVCSGHGSCIDYNTCKCLSGYDGTYCEYPICFGILASNSSVCSNGNGTCVGVDTCNCRSGWIGADCGMSTCYGIPENSSSVCKGHGSCSAGACYCHTDWTGSNCGTPICFGNTGRKGCNQHGACVLNNTCQCDTNWFGSDCSIHSCGGISATDSATCSSHGSCISMDNCNCFDGYNGSLCETQLCFGISKDDVSVCSSKGVCSGPNKCTCYETLIGKSEDQECSTIKCIGPNNQWINSNDPNVCSKHGSCLFTNSTDIGCQCANGYTGEYCQWNICYGLSETSNQVCSGHGSCSAPNQCTCHDDDVNGHFVGSQCDQCKAPYSGINCNTIEKCNAADKCNSHGICDDFGFCSCYQDTLKGYWNGTNCQNCKNGYYGEDCLTQFISNVKFNNQGSALIFQMTYPYHFESMNVDCNMLLETEKISLFGSNPTCRYSNRTTFDFIIELDQDHSININDKIKLNRNVFNRISKVKDYSLFNIDSASQPSNPIISISQKASYASCENVQIDASESYSLDRKQLTFKWEIVNSNLNSISVNNSSKLSINYRDLNAGSHTFKLTITSFIFETTASKQVTFQKLDYSTPIISIDGSDKMTVKPGADLPIILRKKIILPDCLAPNSEVVVNWEYLSGTGAQYQVDSFNNLKISKFNDLSQTSHQFSVSTFVKGNNLQKSTAIVNIELSISPLTVNLVMVETTVDYVTFEVEEIDSDGENVKFSRSWSFNNLVNSNSILNYLQSSSNSSFTITKQMASGSNQFDITLESSKGSRKSKSTISLTFPTSITKIPPMVTLVNSVPSKVNKGDLLNIQLLVSGEGKMTREWLLNSCNCAIVPTTGVAMTTQFTFNCPSCQNAEKTYKFEYGFVDDYSGTYITLSKDEELYQKLPAPNTGSELVLYVKVTDSLTGAFTLSTRNVTISLPVAKNPTEVQKLVKTWNSVASLLAVGDYRRSVFNIATIAKTATMMLKVISSKRSVCSGNGKIGSDGKCICNQGYASNDCKFTLEQFETIQSICSDLLNDFINSNQIKLQSGEITNREYLTTTLFGIDSILQNYEYFNSKLFNSSLIVFKQYVDAIESTSSLTFTSSEIVYLKGILNSLYKVVSNNADFVYQSRKLGGLILRSILMGQSPLKFETNYHLNLLNKHFKSELNSMILESENTNITLPSTISQSISTKSVKTPVTYDWFILKDTSSFLKLPQKSDNVVSLVSVVNDLQLIPSPSLIPNSKIVYSVKMNTFKNEATYSCAHMSNYETIVTTNDCSLKIENQIAKCECSQLYNIAILEYLPNSVIIPEKPSSGGISDLYWILWGFLIAIFIVICLVVLGIIGVVVYKREKKLPDSFSSAQHSSLEMKQV